MQGNRERVLAWIQLGFIEEKNAEQALQVGRAQPDKQHWYQFSKQLLLWLSIICLCSGVVFFFAYNWQGLSRLARFSLVESAMLIVSLSYLAFSANQKVKVALLMAMVLFTGSLLALVGQTYQTGADPWQLFAIWCLLMTPWALVARSSVVWIFWVILLNVCCVLLLQLELGLQRLVFGYRADMLLSLTLINTIALSVFELGAKLNKLGALQKFCFVSQRNRYTQQLLLCLSMYYLCYWIIGTLFEDSSTSYWVMIYLLTSALVYRFVIQDLLALAIISVGFLVVSSGFIFSRLESLHAMFEGFLLLGAIYFLGASSVIGIYLNKLAKRFNAQQHSVESEREEKEQL